MALAVQLAGCATPPPSPPPVPVPVPPPPAAIEAPATLPVCTPCTEQAAEVARLRQELANREAELRDLRSQQRDQVKALQESTKQVARAKVKLRRLATQADAASYVAEVEVMIETARSAPGAGSRVPLLVLARELLDSSAEPFAQGDYGTAIDIAVRAEQLIAILQDSPVRAGTRGATNGETLFEAAIPLRVKVECNLRRQPRDKAAVVAVLIEGLPVVAYAYRDNWLRVETEDGRSGWVFESLLGAR